MVKLLFSQDEDKCPYRAKFKPIENYSEVISDFEQIYERHGSESLFSISGLDEIILIAETSAFNFIIEDVSDQEGLPGQCSTNPSSYFNNHQISLIDGVYYDACYGVTFDSLEDIPYDAFSGWGFRYNSGGVTHARFTNEMGATELSQSITTF